LDYAKLLICLYAKELAVNIKVSLWGHRPRCEYSKELAVGTMVERFWTVLMVRTG